MVMRSFQSIAVSLAFWALMGASGTCARAEAAPLGVRLVDQMNVLYGAHPGVRANHAKGAVFEGMFTPAQGADALSSAVFLKGAATPLVIRFSNAGGMPNGDGPLPSLRGHYTRFIATTKQSAPARRIGTFGLAVGAACAFSLGIADPVLTFHTRA